MTITVSSNNPTTASDAIFNQLTLREKELLIRYEQRFPGSNLISYSVASLRLLVQVQEHFELNNPPGQQLTAEQLSLQEEVIAIRRDLLRLTGLTVQELENKIAIALDIQSRVEQEETSLQLELDLSSEIAAAQAELIRRLQPPVQPTPQPTPQPQPQPPGQEPGLRPGLQPNPLETGEEEENPGEIEPIDISSYFQINPLPDLTPPLDTKLSLAEYLQLRDSNNIRYTIPYVVNQVLNEYRLTEFLDEPIPRFYNSVITFVNQYIQQHFRNNDETELNANERSVVNEYRVRIGNINQILSQLPRLTDYIREGVFSEDRNQVIQGVPYPDIHYFVQASTLLRQQGLNVTLRTETTFSRSWDPLRRLYKYKPRYTAHIADYVAEVNAEAQVLVNDVNTIIANSHIRTPLRLQLEKQIDEQNALLAKTNLTQEVYDSIVVELDQTTALLRRLGEVNLEFEQSKIQELTTDYRELANKLDDTIQDEQDDILEGLNQLGNFFASPVLALGQVLTSLLDPSAAGMEESLIRMTEAQENYSRRRQSQNNAAGGI